MKLRLALSASALSLLALGCGKTATDASPVVIAVGAERVSEKDVQDLVGVLAENEAQKQMLLSEAGRGERVQLANSLAQQKALLQLGRQEGLDQDPKIQLMIEAAKAQIYREALMQRRVAKVQPTEDQLKAFYARVAAERKAQGQETPAYEVVKAQLPAAWQQQQMEQMKGAFKEELNQKVVTTHAPGYEPQPMMPMGMAH